MMNRKPQSKEIIKNTRALEQQVSTCLVLWKDKSILFFWEKPRWGEYKTDGAVATRVLDPLPSNYGMPAEVGRLDQNNA